MPTHFEASPDSTIFLKSGTSTPRNSKVSGFGQKDDATCEERHARLRFAQGDVEVVALGDVLNEYALALGSCVAKSLFFCRKPACVAWVCFLV